MSNSASKSDQPSRSQRPKFNPTVLIIVILALAGAGIASFVKKRQSLTSASLAPDNTEQIDQMGSNSSLFQGQGSPAQINLSDQANNQQQPQQSADQGEQMNKTQMPKPPMVIDPSKQYVAKMSTNYGDIIIQFFADDTPKTVNNFIYLAAQGFYDGLIFHRVIDDFMIQGGDPLGNGQGGPGYKFADEESSHKLVKGSVAMANSGPDTNGSQFFIVTADAAPWLDGKHTNFGQVVQGMEVVEKIEAVETDAQDRPKEPVVIKSVKVAEQPPVQQNQTSGQAPAPQENNEPASQQDVPLDQTQTAE